MMSRRSVLSMISAQFSLGCIDIGNAVTRDSKMPPLAGPQIESPAKMDAKEKIVRWKDLIAHEINSQISSRNHEPIQFDPALIAILVPFLVGLVKDCLLQNVLQQHRAVNRRPDGRVAKSMRTNIAESFRAKYADADETTVDQHVEASIDAFREASVLEVTELYKDAQHAPPEEVIDWDKAKVRTISQLRN